MTQVQSIHGVYGGWIEVGGRIEGSQLFFVHINPKSWEEDLSPLTLGNTPQTISMTFATFPDMFPRFLTTFWRFGVQGGSRFKPTIFGIHHQNQFGNSKLKALPGSVRNCFKGTPKIVK